MKNMAAKSNPEEINRCDFMIIISCETTEWSIAPKLDFSRYVSETLKVADNPSKRGRRASFIEDTFRYTGFGCAYEGRI